MVASSLSLPDRVVVIALNSAMSIKAFRRLHTSRVRNGGQSLGSMRADRGQESTTPPSSTPVSPWSWLALPTSCPRLGGQRT